MKSSFRGRHGALRGRDSIDTNDHWRVDESWRAVEKVNEGIYHTFHNDDNGDASQDIVDTCCRILINGISDQPDIRPRHLLGHNIEGQ